MGSFIVLGSSSGAFTVLKVGQFGCRSMSGGSCPTHDHHKTASSWRTLHRSLIFRSLNSRDSSLLKRELFGKSKLTSFSASMGSLSMVFSHTNASMVMCFLLCIKIHNYAELRTLREFSLEGILTQTTSHGICDQEQISRKGVNSPSIPMGGVPQMHSSMP